MNTKSKKGFTLVEIMILVGIIGLLAAMAVPAFQKARTNSIAKSIVNDGRQLGSAAQQYFMEEGASEITVVINPNTGLVDAALPLTEYVTSISPKLTYAGGTIATNEGGTNDSFTLQHALGNVSFNNEGKPTNADGPFDEIIKNQLQ